MCFYNTYYEIDEEGFMQLHRSGVGCICGK